MGFGKDKKGVIFRQRGSITLGTLASVTAVKQNSVPAVTDSFRMIKSEGKASLEGATFVDLDGPVELWLCSDDLSVAEIAECISAGAGQPLSREDIIGTEQANRPCYYLGQVEFALQGGSDPMGYIEWAKTIRWTFGDGTAFTLMAFNAGAALTAGGVLRFFHQAYGVWVGA